MFALEQEDVRFVTPIRKWGCYLLSLHFFVSKFKGLVFKHQHINTAYEEFVARSFIRSNCYIVDPSKVLKWYGILASVRYENISYRSREEEFEITEVKLEAGSSHFIATQDNNVIYDSLNLDKRGRLYNKFSKRIFTKKEVSRLDKNHKGKQETYYSLFSDRGSGCGSSTGAL
ncbi:MULTISPECIES: DUF261 family protein [unclassified Borrelia]|uniref:DUF261 family protein n=1 Tax=unclassified Borrelia TaxID=2649934 RepID=UPI001E52F288|nr:MULTISPECIES: DUF261 family protein [unclassified Borrelia]UGQ16670.1 DUF261 domain-containing protein [Borrelia sp. RT5S]UGQ17713.1 DUF261 family protein [Borrelia sp. RT1S]UGQ17827.1 DUF261 family protein [Borrelia sp. RT1S]